MATRRRDQGEHANPTGLDAYRPEQIARLVEQAGVAKARLPLPQMFTLALLAGAFIGFGALFYTVVMTGAEPGFGPARLLGGVAFSLGLILVIVGGAELFTGNALAVMAWVDRQISTMELTRNWTIVYVGNFAGAVVLAALVAQADLLGGAMGALAVKIAAGKVALAFGEAFFRGILCNALVCLAVWLAVAARTAAGKILAIVWPISAFVAIGLEHSVANMYFLTVALFAGLDAGAADIAGNLLPVTLGNIVGGAGGVALAYWAAYGRYRPWR